MFRKSLGKGAIVVATLLASALLVSQLANSAPEASSERAIAADAARWTGLAASYAALEAQQRAAAADDARWTGLAASYTAPQAQQRAAAAEDARWTGLAEYYLDQVGK